MLTQPPTPPTSNQHDMADSCILRLKSILIQLESTRTSLIGSRPEGQSSGQPTPETLDAKTNFHFDLISQIEMEVQAISRAIGFHSGDAVKVGR